MDTILTGIRVNGELTLGNFLGALVPMVRLANEHNKTHNINIFVPDLHTIISDVDGDLQKNIIKSVKYYLAAGLKVGGNVHFYRQSYVPAHSELNWILNCVASMGELNRMTQFKEKSEGKESVNAGIFDYPVLMAADILLYDARYVPVGEDQFQHLELTRNLAIRINNRFDEPIFTPPEKTEEQVKFMNLDGGIRIRDLQNPEKDLIKTGVWEAIYDIRTLLLDLQVASNKGVPYINACASENIKCFVKRYFDPYNPDYLRITSKVCKQFQEYMLENIDYIAMGYTIPIPLINMDGCCVVDSNGNLQYKIAANNLAGAKNVIIRNQMVMNPQIMPPNNIVNNNMNNNMLPNNVNNHMGMNNSNLIPQGIQNNSLMNQRIDEGLNLVNQKNNVGERNPDHHSVKNRIYTFNQGGVGFSRQPVTSNMNNNPEYLFGLKCLGKKPQEISECCAKLYWPSCC